MSLDDATGSQPKEGYLEAEAYRPDQIHLHLRGRALTTIRPCHHGAHPAKEPINLWSPSRSGRKRTINQSTRSQSINLLLASAWTLLTSPSTSRFISPFILSALDWSHPNKSHHYTRQPTSDESICGKSQRTFSVKRLRKANTLKGYGAAMDHSALYQNASRVTHTLRPHSVHNLSMIRSKR
jgi:hypothetical protein